MEVKKVIINDVECNLFVDVLIKGKKICVASPQLNEEIVKLIEKGHFSDSTCIFDGKKVLLSEVDKMYYYIYGDEDNLNPTEQEVIESIEDVLDEIDIRYIDFY